MLRYRRKTNSTHAFPHKNRRRQHLGDTVQIVENSRRGLAEMLGQALDESLGVPAGDSVPAGGRGGRRRGAGQRTGGHKEIKNAREILKIQVETGNSPRKSTHPYATFVSETFIVVRAQLPVGEFAHNRFLLAPVSMVIQNKVRTSKHSSLKLE